MAATVSGVFVGAFLRLADQCGRVTKDPQRVARSRYGIKLLA